MMQPDSLHALTDTAKSLSADTLARLDSLAKADSVRIADSIRVADSLKAVAAIPRGFVGKPILQTPYTESWVFGVLLLLFLLLVFSISHSKAYILETIKTFFQVKTRSSIFSKITLSETRFRFFLLLFSMSIVSFFAYLIIYPTSGKFSFIGYSLFLGVTLLFFGLKSLLIDLMGYIFSDPVSTKMGKESYFNIVFLLGIALSPLLILRIYSADYVHNITDLLSIIVCIIGGILVIIKLFQIFYHKVIASFYILLYLCTLEFLPLFALFKAYQFIVLSVSF